MDERVRDLEDKIARLRTAIRAADPNEAYAAAEAAGIAIAFRNTDEEIGLPPISAKAIRNLNRLRREALAFAAKQGLAQAAVTLAEDALRDGDVDTAVDHYYAAAKSGDPETVAKAAELIRRADRNDLAEEMSGYLDVCRESESGSVEYVRGLYAFNGFGRKKDLPSALELHQSAARKGNADAMFELYAMLAQGLGTSVDEKGSMRWCIKAAKAGNVRAMANLGGFYATGHGVAKNVKQSVTWYDRAARAGHGKAAATLGIMFATGADVKQDPASAREYFSLAEDVGFDWPTMALELGVLNGAEIELLQQLLGEPD